MDDRYPFGVLESFTPPRFGGSVIATQARRINQSSPPATSTERPSLAEQLYGALKTEILTGGLAPGEVINEPALASRYAVSKTPVREALRLLVYSGWIVTLPRKGYLVKPLGIRDLTEIYALRRILEPPLAAEAARRASESSVTRLHGLLAEQGDPKTDTKRATELSREFHLVIASMSGNERAIRIVEPLIDDYARLVYLVPRLQSTHPYSDAELQDHRTIADAIGARDPSVAEEAMREHVTTDGRNVMRMYTEEG